MIKELYSNEPNTIEYPIVSDIAPTDFVATIKVGNDRNKLVDIAVPLTVTGESTGEYKAIVPNNILNGFRYAKVVIEYTLGQHGLIRDEFFYKITKRYLRFPDMRALLTGEYDLQEDEFNFIERDVRYQIEAYCNQKFDGWYGTQDVYSTPGFIGLPEHLEYMEYVTPLQGIQSVLSHPGFELTNNGFAIVNEDRARVKTIFGDTNARKARYTIRGQWGYSSVPAAVQQAAVAIFQAKMCDDVEYRNKYIKSIRNENIRIEFRDELYDGHTTGNAFADDILDPYVAMPLGAI